MKLLWTVALVALLLVNPNEGRRQPKRLRRSTAIVDEVAEIIANLEKLTDRVHKLEEQSHGVHIHLGSDYHEKSGEHKTGDDHHDTHQTGTEDHHDDTHHSNAHTNTGDHTQDHLGTTGDHSGDQAGHQGDDHSGDQAGHQGDDHSDDQAGHQGDHHSGDQAGHQGDHHSGDQTGHQGDDHSGDQTGHHTGDHSVAHPGDNNDHQNDDDHDSHYPHAKHVYLNLKLAGGCCHDKKAKAKVEHALHAHCEVTPNKQTPDLAYKIRGHIELTQEPHHDEVTVKYHLKNLKPHTSLGVHIHETGDLTKCCNSLGDHYNPTKHHHGSAGSKDSHVGDLGNIAGDEHTLFTHTKTIHADLHDLIGRSIAINAKADDRTGSHGGPVACCVIGRSHDDDHDNDHHDNQGDHHDDHDTHHDDDDTHHDDHDTHHDRHHDNRHDDQDNHHNNHHDNHHNDQDNHHNDQDNHHNDQDNHHNDHDSHHNDHDSHHNGPDKQHDDHDNQHNDHDNHQGDDHQGDDHQGDDHQGDDHQGDDHQGDDHQGDDHHGQDQAGHDTGETHAQDKTHSQLDDTVHHG